ncbi:MAG TPA: hypothetical protein ENN69_08855 [Spirochaetia bacterium]|nr:hypothetical protein [Spirochaetia bacterium]
MKLITRALKEIYDTLYRAYGPQGWWPVRSGAQKRGQDKRLRGGEPASVRNTCSPDDRGYHPGNYEIPAASAEKFEVAVGAILTQNTAWTNVELSLSLLRNKRLLSPQAIISAPPSKLSRLIRSSGYYNQKALKLKGFADACTAHGWFSGRVVPAREELLAVWGIGEETADSILLYAFHHPRFVVDAYTRRLFSRLGFIEEKQAYPAIQAVFEKNLPPERILFNEYHALIVEHAKRHCRKRPRCAGCMLTRRCRFHTTACHATIDG